MVEGIQYDENRKWIFLYNPLQESLQSKDKIILFGILAPEEYLNYNSSLVLITYELEDNLESAVNTFVNEAGYYQWQAEHVDFDEEDNKYMGESEKYPPLTPPSPDPDELIVVEYVDGSNNK